MQPISNDKRTDIISAKLRKEPVLEIVKWFYVSESTISRIWNKYKKSGEYVPIYKGRRSVITPDDEKKIVNKINEIPNITLNELIKEFSLNITASGLSRRLSKIIYKHNSNDKNN